MKKCRENGFQLHNISIRKNSHKYLGIIHDSIGLLVCRRFLDGDVSGLIVHRKRTSWDFSQAKRSISNPWGAL